VPRTTGSESAKDVNKLSVSSVIEGASFRFGLWHEPE
jgi:hypothetical protein